MNTAIRSAKLFFLITNQKRAKPPMPTTATEPITIPTIAPAPSPSLSSLGSSGVLFGLSGVLLAMSAGFVGLPEDAAIVLIPVSVILMLGVVLFYTLKIWWIGRGLQ